MSNEATVPTEDTDETPVPKFIDLALSEEGERTGEYKRVQVRMPSETQMMWFEATFHRFNLALGAMKAGGQFSESERGEIYNDVLDAVNVFVANLHDRQWIGKAMARGMLEFDAIIEGISAAATALDMPLGDAIGQGADVVVE